MSALCIEAPRLFERLRALGAIGRDGDGRLTRLAGSNADKLGRDALVGWLREAGLDVLIDRVGNIFGLWRVGAGAPVMMGSHIDTVIDAGIYDGCYGVLAGLSVIEAMKAAGLSPARPLAVAAFTNEEGVRFAPDMLGSLVFAGGLSVEAALASVGVDGARLGEELERIGYAGEIEPGAPRPFAYVELHVEQGPALDAVGETIGVVDALQGISWRRVTLEGAANHAGTTPLDMRRDAGLVAARAIALARDIAEGAGSGMVATVGTLTFEPGAINVIPARATLTLDLRCPNEAKLAQAEADFSRGLDILAQREGVGVTTESLARFSPVVFDAGVAAEIEKAAQGRGLSHRRMISGAGHDAQMMARIAPSAMIFVPSRGGISHSPHEFTGDAHLIAGANVLLDTARALSGADA